MLTTTNNNPGNAEIQLSFYGNHPYQAFGNQRIETSWQYCFPSGALASVTIQNTDGKGWTGDISFTHDNPKKVLVFQKDISK